MKFMCKQSKEVYEFTQEHDIKGMLEHPDYIVVTEEIIVEEPKKKKYTAAKVTEEN